MKMPKENWALARLYYERDGWLPEMISDYFGRDKLLPSDVSARAIRDRWVPPEHQHTDREMTRSMARKQRIQDVASRDLEIQVAKAVTEKLGELVGEVREEAIVEANALEVSRVMLLHRTGATGMREMLSRMFSELKLASLSDADLMGLIHVVAQEEGEEDSKKIATAFRKVMGLDSRADIAKKLVDSMIKVVDLERRVYGIRDEGNEDDVAKALRELADG